MPLRPLRPQFPPAQPAGAEQAAGLPGPGSAHQGASGRRGGVLLLLAAQGQPGGAGPAIRLGVASPSIRSGFPKRDGLLQRLQRDYPELERIVLKAMALDPAERYQDASGNPRYRWIDASSWVTMIFASDSNMQLRPVRLLMLLARSRMESARSATRSR